MHYLEESSHLDFGLEGTLHILLLLQLVLEGGGQHVGEQLQGHWQQQFHERNNDECGHRDQSEDIRDGIDELLPRHGAPPIGTQDVENEEGLEEET